MQQSIRVLEVMEKDYANFHLVFLLGLTRHLGICPQSDGYRKGMYFDLRSGTFSIACPSGGHYLNPGESRLCKLLLRMNYENMSLFAFSRFERRDIILRILDYYRIHLRYLPVIKSIEVLHELFS
jgi:DNA repair protein RecO (recombination protein O)